MYNYIIYMYVCVNVCGHNIMVVCMCVQGRFKEKDLYLFTSLTAYSYDIDLYML